MKCSTTKKNVTELEELYEQFLDYGEELCVVGFFSGKYDLNLVKEYIFTYFAEKAPWNHPHVIKRNSSFLSVCSPDKTLKMLDICNYLSPGTSYSAFLKCFETQECKAKFPFRWFTSAANLNETKLPPRTMFDNCTETEYDTFKEKWVELGMTTMADFLEYYNHLDVGPFVEALGKMIILFSSHGLDILKAVSISKAAFMFC